MERQTIKKPLNGTSNNLHYMGRPFEQKTTLQDASFSSSYLIPEPPAPPKPSDTNRFTVDDSDQISVFEAENYFSEKDQNNNNNKRDSSTGNGQDHDKTGCEFSTISRLSSVSSTDGYGYGGKLRARSFHATPTASSEASWNSQTGLLSNPQGSIPISLRNIPSDNISRRNGGCSSGNGAKWFLGLKCPCYGKNSVQVEDNILSEQKTTSSSYPRRHSPRTTNHHHHPTEAENRTILSQNNSISITKKAEESIPEQEVLDQYQPFSSENRFGSNEGHPHHRRRRHLHNHNQGGLGSFRDGVAFSFPILNGSVSGKMQAPTRPPMDEPARESLEVFQPPEESRGYGYPTSPMSRLTGTEEDGGGSDASSDLFEIESFSTTQTTSYRRRDSLDDEAAARASYGRRQSVEVDEPVTPSVAASTECGYEPSEASINWSVTTAEGFGTNFSVSASEFGDVAELRSADGGGWSKKRSGGNGGGGLTLLSCRWEKAVSVGPTQQHGKWGQEDGGGGGGGGGRRVVGGGGGGGGGPPLPMISTMRHVSSRPYKR